MRGIKTGTDFTTQSNSGDWGIGPSMCFRLGGTDVFLLYGCFFENRTYPGIILLFAFHLLRYFSRYKPLFCCFIGRLLAIRLQHPPLLSAVFANLISVLFQMWFITWLSHDWGTVLNCKQQPFSVAVATFQNTALRQKKTSGLLGHI